MKPNDTNQGEGNRDADRQYRSDVREFISKGKVGAAAKDAKDFVEQNPAEAKAAEQAAKHGSTVDELIAKGKGIVERVKNVVEEKVSDLRTKYGKKG